jgi:hypothetical protein
MKKKITFSALTFLLMFTVSCSDESNTELELQTSNETTSINRSLTGKPGDGAYDVLGAGYDVTKEFANANSAGFQIIDIVKFKTEQAGRLIEELTYSSEYKEVYGENALSYAKVLSKKTNSTSTNVVYGQTVSSTFTQNTSATNKFEGKYIYGSYSLEIKQKRLRFNTTIDLLKEYLTPEFVADLQQKTPQEITRDYGTHVLLDIYTGAKLNVLYQSETGSLDRALAARAGVKSSVGTVFNLDVNNDVDQSYSNNNYNRKISYNTRGGNPSKSLIGTINLEKTPVQTLNITDWQNSVDVSNSVLIDIAPNGLVYIYDLISDPVKKAQIKKYVDQYLIDNSVYTEDIPINIYGFYSPNFKDHYYNQKSNIPEFYVPEGIPFKAYNYRAENTVPIYMYYSSKESDHYYSQSPQVPLYYISEGIAFYAYPTKELSLNGAIPIYMFYSGREKDHYYSQLPVIPQYYVSEGIGFYAHAL